MNKEQLAEIVSLLRESYDRREHRNTIPNGNVPILEQLKSVMTNLRKQKVLVYEQRLKETNEYILQYQDEIQLSCFELMEHNYRENSHSNVLHYIFNPRLNGTVTQPILIEFLRNIPSEETGQFAERIGLSKFTIEREVVVNRGRMDLLIKDDKNRWVIVVENKIYANIGYKEDLNIGEPISQLAVYEQHINKKYPSYDKLFILLSYTDIDADVTPYHKADYRMVYNALRKYNGNDVIMREYRRLLYSLLNDIPSKEELFEKIEQVQNYRVFQLNILEDINGALLKNAYYHR